MYLELFITFCKIGLFTFGGGYAMLPMLEKEVVENKKWATQEELMDYFAVAQCTPGAIAVNTATFIGFYKKGILGGIVATLGVIFPSLIIILILAMFLNNFSNLAIVQHALVGIRIAVCVLILNAVIKLFKAGVKNIETLIVCILAFICTYLNLLPTVIIVLISACIGIFLQIKKGAKS
jgi:chromate transporter